MYAYKVVATESGLEPIRSAMINRQACFNTAVLLLESNNIQNSTQSSTESEISDTVVHCDQQCS
jgi:hypothetical protein